jgi:hypothetical protein
MDEMRLLMANETCNVAASELTILLGFGLSKYGVGDTLFTKDPHAFGKLALIACFVLPRGFYDKHDLYSLCIYSWQLLEITIVNSQMS